MHIIIEGLDKTGKSWLTRELAKRLYMPTINRCQPKKSIFIECVDTLINLPTNMIIDRLHLSEMAYGPIKRNKVRFNSGEYRIIELICLSLGTFNIYCKAPIDFIKQKFVEDKEDFLEIKDIMPVSKLFNKALKESMLDWHTYQIGDSIDELAKKITKHFEKIKYEKRI